MFRSPLMSFIWKILPGVSTIKSLASTAILLRLTEASTSPDVQSTKISHFRRTG